MSASKQKGTAAETAVVTYLQKLGWAGARRNPPAGSLDKGDIDGVDHFVIEVKNHRELNLAGWVAEAERERAVAGRPFAVVWHKRRGKAQPSDWYVTMTGATFARLALVLDGETALVNESLEGWDDERV